MSRFWQVVYSFVPKMRNRLERLGSWVKEMRVRVSIGLLVAVIVTVFLCTSADAFDQHPDGSATFSHEEMTYILGQRNELVRRLMEAYEVIKQQGAALEQERSKRCI